MTKLEGWIGNRADAPAALDVEETAREFVESGWMDEYEGWPLDRALSLFLASDASKDGRPGKNLAWDPRDPASAAAYEEIAGRVIELRSAKE